MPNEESYKFPGSNRLIHMKYTKRMIRDVALPRGTIVCEERYVQANF